MTVKIHFRHMKLPPSVFMTMKCPHLNLGDHQHEYQYNHDEIVNQPTFSPFRDLILTFLSQLYNCNIFNIHHVTLLETVSLI